MDAVLPAGSVASIFFAVMVALAWRQMLHAYTMHPYAEGYRINHYLLTHPVMPKVREEEVYMTECSKGLLPKVDFADTFTTTNAVDNLEKISKSMFDQSPAWVDTLFRIRNSLVRFFGLKTTLPAGYHQRFEIGGYIRFFKIMHLFADEIVLGANDSHLDFRAVIKKTKDREFNIKVTTLVSFNNRFGKIYMRLIAPFHRLVIRRMVGQAYAAIQTP